jgi:hypothetical protein
MATSEVIETLRAAVDTSSHVNNRARTGSDVMEQFIPACPLAAKLGIVAEVLEGD